MGFLEVLIQFWTLWNLDVVTPVTPDPALGASPLNVFAGGLQQNPECGETSGSSQSEGTVEPRQEEQVSRRGEFGPVPTGPAERRVSTGTFQSSHRLSEFPHVDVSNIADLDALFLLVSR